MDILVETRLDGRKLEREEAIIDDAWTKKHSGVEEYLVYLYIYM
jgi:hypothetical protein